MHCFFFIVWKWASWAFCWITPFVFYVIKNISLCLQRLEFDGNEIISPNACMNYLFKTPCSWISFRSFQCWKLQSFIEAASILRCSCTFIYHRWMKVLLVLHLEWFYSREQEMSLWLDVLECFSALFIDPLKLLSLIVKFSFHSSALTFVYWLFSIWPFPF